jgi:uncharacterized RDD family membrane protein YckC
MESNINNVTDEVIEEIYMPASMWSRFLASLIDSLIVMTLLIVSLIVVLLVYTFLNLIFSDGSPMSDTELEGIFFLILLIVNFLYFSLMESSKSMATLGKIALNIMVTDYDGERISYGKSVKRTLSKYISGSFFYIGYLMGFFTENIQMFHDFVAKTYVVGREPFKETVDESHQSDSENLY